MKEDSTSESTSFREAEILVNDDSSIEEHPLIENESPYLYKNPFLNRAFKEKSLAVYEKAQYECRFRFDENFRWTMQAQQKLTWKLDFKVTLLACVLFASLQIDRSNMGMAVSDNLLKDLKMTTNNYNTGNTIFTLCFLFSELPSQLVSKKLGPDVWIPIQVSLWSLVTLCQFRLTDKKGFYACRALLGLLEGGFIPDLILWLSYFYSAAELSLRVASFWSAMHVAQICNYLIAYGILHMRGIQGKAGWAWLFLIEGLITLSIGISSFFLMVPSPVETKRLRNKKGWFTEEEEKIVVNKVLIDDPTKGEMNNRQGLTPKKLWEALCDWHLWPIYFLGLVHLIPQDTISSYLTLLLKQMGYSTFHTNLLCIPSQALIIVFTIVCAYLSEKLKDIFGFSLIHPFWSVPMLGILRFWKGSLVNRWSTYAVLLLMMGGPTIYPMLVSACSRNSQSIKTRTVSASLYNMFVQAGSVIASNIYRTPDKPLYHTGNSVLFAIALFTIPTLIFTKCFYIFLNKKRDRIWNAMNEKEQVEYIRTTTDKGSSRLDFRFAH